MLVLERSPRKGEFLLELQAVILEFDARDVLHDGGVTPYLLISPAALAERDVVAQITDRVERLAEQVRAARSCSNNAYGSKETKAQRYGTDY